MFFFNVFWRNTGPLTLFACAPKNVYYSNHYYYYDYPRLSKIYTFLHAIFQSILLNTTFSYLLQHIGSFEGIFKSNLI